MWAGTRCTPAVAAGDSWAGSRGPRLGLLTASGGGGGDGDGRGEGARVELAGGDGVPRGVGAGGSPVPEARSSGRLVVRARGGQPVLRGRSRPPVDRPDRQNSSSGTSGRHTASHAQA